MGLLFVTSYVSCFVGDQPEEGAQGHPGLLRRCSRPANTRLPHA